MISFRMDWFELPADQGTLKNLLQHHSSKASILQYSAFFIVQLSHSYMTTGKTRLTFVDKIMSLLFNMLSAFVIVFLARRAYRAPIYAGLVMDACVLTYLSPGCHAMNMCRMNGRTIR